MRTIFSVARLSLSLPFTHSYMYIHTYTYIVVAVPGQNSMRLATVNAVL